MTVRDFIGMVPGVNHNILEFPLILVDLARIPPDRFEGSPVLLAVLDALRSASLGRLLERFPHIMDLLAESERNELLRDRMDAMVSYVAAHCDPPRAVLTNK